MRSTMRSFSRSNASSLRFFQNSLSTAMNFSCEGSVLSPDVALIVKEDASYAKEVKVWSGTKGKNGVGEERNARSGRT